MGAVAHSSYSRNAALVQPAADEFQASVLGPLAGGIRHSNNVCDPTAADNESARREPRQVPSDCDSGNGCAILCGIPPGFVVCLTLRRLSPSVIAMA